MFFNGCFAGIDVSLFVNNAFEGVFCPLGRLGVSNKKEMNCEPIFLIGMRACGKTTLGQALAQRTNRAFVDTDHVICERASTDVAGIVACEGWEGFREKEVQVLHDVVQPNMVIATGGGIILRPDNREFMRNYGKCVYLEVCADELWRRLKTNPQAGQRPSLTTTRSAAPESQGVCLEEIQALLTEREQLYRQTAHHVLSVQGKPEEILAALVALCGCPIIEARHE